MSVGSREEKPFTGDLKVCVIGLFTALLSPHVSVVPNVSYVNPMLTNTFLTIVNEFP